MPETKPQFDLAFILKQLALIKGQPNDINFDKLSEKYPEAFSTPAGLATPVTPSPLDEPIKEPKTITVYVCPKIVEWSTITIGSEFSPVRETLVLPGQGQGYLAVFYSREEYDLVHPGFDPWVFKFTVMPNPYRKDDKSAENVNA